MEKYFTFSILLSICTFQQFYVSGHDTTCFSRLFPHVNSISEKYVIYFYKTNGFLVPDKSIPARIISIDSTETLTRFHYRYSNPFKIILAQLPMNMPTHAFNNIRDPIHNLREILVPSRSIFLFIWEQASTKIAGINIQLSNWHANLPIFPSLKLIITLSPSLKCERSTTSVTVICSGYCVSGSSTLFEFERQHHGHDIDSIHSLLFWNAHGKFIPALAQDMFRYIDATPLWRKPLCLSHENLVDSRCTAEIMSLITLAAIHNFTMVLYIKNSANIGRFRVFTVDVGPEHITSSVPYIGENLYFTLLNYLKFNSFESVNIQYCANANLDKHPLLRFTIWHEPLTRGIWSMCFFLICLAALTSYARHHALVLVFHELFVYWAEVFGAKVRARHFVIVWSFSFLLSIVYSNGLGSIVTVALETKGLKTIAELLDQGYKIVYEQYLYNGPYQIEFGTYFKVLGLPINESFKVIDDDSTDFLELLGEKLAITQITSFSQYNAASDAQRMGIRYETKFNCYILQQSIGFKHVHWMIVTENRHWVQVTLDRIRESGLQNQWDQLAIWNAMLKSNLLEKRTLNSDYVEIHDVLAILAVLGGLIVFAITIFCLEVNAICQFFGTLFLISKWTIQVFIDVRDKLFKMGEQMKQSKKLGVFIRKMWLVVSKSQD
ncbi:unnamed protein product [Orchesella dallaii]|uniref:Uncharacterized protein n=1 Tax=Orchesella dallaii TaxID=48710 RepID=A0ABP1RIG5_9HEXA